jgi:tagatose 6-phosphate kinase
VAAAAAELRAAGARAVVASLGQDGLLAVTEEGCWHARPPAAPAGNATGAGDAATAGLARGLLLGQPWPMRLAHAAALGAAAVAAPVAGEFSHADYEHVAGLVTVERLAVTADGPVTECPARAQAVGASVEGGR